jgi:hypothetical protein
MRQLILALGSKIVAFRLIEGLPWDVANIPPLWAGSCGSDQPLECRGLLPIPGSVPPYGRLSHFDVCLIFIPTDTEVGIGMDLLEWQPSTTIDRSRLMC